MQIRETWRLTAEAYSCRVAGSEDMEGEGEVGAVLAGRDPNINRYDGAPVTHLVVQFRGKVTELKSELQWMASQMNKLWQSRDMTV